MSAVLQIVPEVVDLRLLLRKIADAHAAVRHEGAMAEHLARKQIESAREAGRWLLEAKERLPHGAFGQWVAENLSFSHATANDYMAIATHWADIPSAPNLRSALRQIAERRKWRRERTARLGLTYEQLELVGIDLPIPPVWQQRRPAGDADYYGELRHAVHRAAGFTHVDPAKVAAELARKPDFRARLRELIVFLQALDRAFEERGQR